MNKSEIIAGTKVNAKSFFVIVVTIKIPKTGRSKSILAPRARVKSSRDCIASSHVLPTPAQYQDTTRRRPLYTQNVAKYIRVSTSLQDFQRQEDGLNQYIERNSNWKLYGSFDDMASGKNDQRVGFQNMMKAARGRRFQILILWDLDRLGRSLVDLISNCNELMSLGIDIHFINANMVLNNSPETLLRIVN